MGGAWVFYTCLPLPSSWSLDFKRIARWAPAVGIVIGLILGLVDHLFTRLHVPIQPRSALIVALWTGLTGGLHLDGAMDTADGLGVTDPDRRLTIMTDSHSGAFGVIVAILLLSLKICALMAITQHRALSLVTAITWGRWAQVIAIGQYPYLKPTGKGAFHHENWHSPQDFIPGLLVLISLSLISPSILQLNWLTSMGITLGYGLLTWAIGWWFHHQLGGMTGDVYGAIVEWSEALLLCCLATTLIGGPSLFT